MLDAQLGFFDDGDIADIPERIDRIEVDKIYVSRGDDTYNYDGILADKFAGVLIEGDIFWINETFATLSELARILRPLNVELDRNGSWGNRECNGFARFSKKITKVAKRHSEFFTDDTIYLKKAKFFKEGMIWWYPKDIEAHFKKRLQACNKFNNCNCGAAE